LGGPAASLLDRRVGGGVIWRGVGNFGGGYVRSQA